MVPPERLELSPLAPEASTLSAELRGQAPPTKNTTDRNTQQATPAFPFLPLRYMLGYSYVGPDLGEEGMGVRRVRHGRACCS